MNTICPACLSNTEFFIKDDKYSFVRCVNCRLFFTDPMLTDAELSVVYSPKAKYQSNKLRTNYKTTTNSKFEKIFTEIYKNGYKPKKVLDIGASDGEFLFVAKKKGLDVFGVEPNETTANIANSNGLNVFCGFIEDCHFDKKSFDLLRLGDVLEHSNDPSKLMSLCSEFLVSGGLIVISIPNMDSFWARSTYFFSSLFGLPWSIIEPPLHLSYFSKNNLDVFMKRNGFSFVTSWYHRPPTLKYELGNTHLYGKWKREKTLKNIFRLFFGFSIYISLYIFDYILTPIKKKDYGMVCVYKYNA